ncbi:unnamed protein product [Blepharisma stoltei]|uniref:Uncharacterized protein n=1 Tax=Blepharisma stoltei TaxID=1481888 RepID=A0AAU9K7L4_9CILI|nr:unnamed protein product [Blepharisma stoltei]
MKLLKFLNLWNEARADYHVAEKLSESKSFRKFVVGIVEFPRKIADYLVPDHEIAELKKKEAEKNSKTYLLEDKNHPKYVSNKK